MLRKKSLNIVSKIHFSVVDINLFHLFTLKPDSFLAVVDALKKVQAKKVTSKSPQGNNGK